MTCFCSWFAIPLFYDTTRGHLFCEDRNSIQRSSFSTMREGEENDQLRYEGCRVDTFQPFRGVDCFFRGPLRTFCSSIPFD